MESAEIRQEIYTETTRSIVVTVHPEYIHERSHPRKGIYAFAYTVIIENLGTETTQLIDRRWSVFSGTTKIADIRGEGVVGEQPVLGPGVTFEYTSWTVIRDSVGAMVGSYTFVSEDGDFFEVKIPKFDLIYFDKRTVH